MTSPVPAPLLGRPGGSYDSTADEGEGLLASLGHSLAKVVHMEGEGLDEEEAELPLELTVSNNKTVKKNKIFWNTTCNVLYYVRMRRKSNEDKQNKKR